MTGLGVYDRPEAALVLGLVEGRAGTGGRGGPHTVFHTVLPQLLLSTVPLVYILYM